ncbi:MAG TPA: hypothetical protein PK747_06135 [Acidobacteriota bacterium]|nr:hypothetical protein [Acidobacteriota bacterium]HQO19927.1 hypothetical protein [Acidobacteriota bacterium]HQQ46974.1 hypothetical protein [Acidobacteriota bacterium]
MSLENYVLASIRDGKESRDITVKNYRELLKNQDRKALAEFVYHRFCDRYIKPFEFDDEDYKENYKNGFAIMASCCLMMEALGSFYKGWEDTNNMSKEAINGFIARHPALHCMNTFSFYKNIRCGILHQGETIGGYKITREGKALFLTKTIDAVIFQQEIKMCLEEYSANLEAADWDSELWDNFRKKMKAIINNCESQR